MTHDRDSARIPEEYRAIIGQVVRGALPWPLYIWGPPQFGKTSAVLLLCDHVSGAHFWDFQTVSHVFSQLKKGEPVIFTYKGRDTGEGWREPEKVVRWNMHSFALHLRNCPLIVVDEIALRENPTESQYECLIKILDERRGLPLVLTANSSPDDLESQYDGRIRERIDSNFSGGTVINFCKRWVK